MTEISLLRLMNVVLMSSYILYCFEPTVAYGTMFGVDVGFFMAAGRKLVRSRLLKSGEFTCIGGDG